jgi:PilZ domain
MEQDDRRRFPRLKVPVFCRPAGLRFHGAGQAVDIGLGGARVFADERVPVGTHFELELLLPDSSAIVCKAVVAWIEALPAGSQASFDLGLRFTDVSEVDQRRLASVLAVSG